MLAKAGRHGRRPVRRATAAVRRVGWLREEITACGVSFRNPAGRRADEQIRRVARAVVRITGRQSPGARCSFENVVCNPKPVAGERFRSTSGGTTLAAARRAGRLGDGFWPLGGHRSGTAAPCWIWMRSAALGASRPQTSSCRWATRDKIDPDRRPTGRAGCRPRGAGHARRHRFARRPRICCRHARAAARPDPREYRGSVGADRPGALAMRPTSTTGCSTVCRGVVRRDGPNLSCRTRPSTSGRQSTAGRQVCWMRSLLRWLPGHGTRSWARSTTGAGTATGRIACVAPPTVRDRTISDAAWRITLRRHLYALGRRRLAIQPARLTIDASIETPTVRRVRA